jgi:hypothetical protein
MSFLSGEENSFEGLKIARQAIFSHSSTSGQDNIVPHTVYFANQSKTSWIHYVPLEYHNVALISASTGKSIKATCCGSFLYRNYVPNIIVENVLSNLQQWIRYS